MDAQIYLEPIPGSDPAGKDLRYEREYDDLKEARRSDDETAPDDPWHREVKRADWDRVVHLGTQILLDKSKDLEVIAYMTEAWAHLRGLPGIRDGLELLQAVQGAFWETVHPRPEDGDLELRRGVYEFLDDPKLLPLRVQNTMLTRVEGNPEKSYSCVKYKEAMNTEKRIKEGRSEEEFEGNLRLKDFDEAAAQTPREFYVAQVEALRQFREAVERFNEDISQRWPARPRERPPQLSVVLTAIEEVEAEARRLLGRKKPPPEAEKPPEEPPTAVAEEIEPDADSGWGEEPVAEPAPRPVAPRARRPARPGAAPTSADEALAQIVDAAQFLRQADPADPVSYLVLRALQSGRLYRGDGALASGDLPAPASEVRERLSRLSREDQWDGLLDESERAMAQPEGSGWLDPHYYSVRALEALGHAAAARACKAVLAACLKDHEEWTGASLRDETPCASGRTRDWIASEFAVGQAFQPDSVGRPSTSGFDGRSRAIERAEAASYRDEAADGPRSTDGVPASPDPWDEAQALARSHRLNEAIAVMVQAVRQARTGRERFLRTLQQAELCLASGRPALALPLLEMLAQRIDALHLEQWEDGSLCARVLSHLYRCLKGKDDARAATIYNRLCQIDAGEALLLGAT